MRLPARLCLILLALHVFSACTSPALGSVEGSFERRLSVSGPVDLTVTTGSGDITVRTGDEAVVRIFGKIRASNDLFGSDDVENRIRSIEEHPPIEQNGDVIRIGQNMDNKLLRHISISYELVVPATTRLRSRTGSGEHTIDGLRGPVDAGSGSGDVRISKVNADVHVETGSGDIYMTSVEGAVLASTGSGNIRAKGVGGDLKASTGSGDVSIEQSSVNNAVVGAGSGNVAIQAVRGALNVSTGSGDVTVQGEVGGEWKAGTGSGNVTLKLSPQASFVLEAKTHSGTIHVAREVTVQGTVGKNELHGKVGSGGHLVQLNTGSGDIRIE